MVEIPEAARRVVRVTPLIDGGALGCRLKLESLQPTGSFKLRGAALKLARLAARGASSAGRGVVCASAGNHGMGMALAARGLGMRVTVVVPEGAALVKREGIARLGAEVITVPGRYDDADRAARALAAERGVAFVSPFDDDDVIDGNGGWLADEIFAQAPDLACVVVPVGGGGIIGGLARELAPRGVSVIGVEPRVNAAMKESLALGRALTVYDGGHTRCEGLDGAVCERTFALVQKYVRGIVTVEEDEVLSAMAFAFRRLGLIVEPSAAVGIAAARAARVPVDARTVVIVTGSNVDAEVLDLALERA